MPRALYRRYLYSIGCFSFRCIGYQSPCVKGRGLEVFYTYFYNHARRLGLEKILYLEVSRSPNGFVFNNFLIQVAVSLLGF
jgi:hypothetical protein